MSASPNKRKFFVFLCIIMTLVVLSSCTPPGDQVIDPFQIIDNEANQLNKDTTIKEQAVWQADSSITHLQEQLDDRDADSSAYYLHIGFKVDTDTGASFVLNIEGNFHSVPYEVDGVIDTAKLEEHNEVIKRNDIVLEWYDGKTNDLLIGFYFDGINPNSADRGNHLYLNLQGEKRIFYDFGDTVAYQQFVRALTSLDIEELLVSGGILNEVGEEDTDDSAVKVLLTHAVTSNYKKVKHSDNIDTILFYNVQLNLVTGSLTNIIQNFFNPYGDKVDPLTKKYLGFEFSVLGNIEILTLNGDIVFKTEMLEERKDNTKDEYSDGNYYLLRGFKTDLSGTSLSQDRTVPFVAALDFDYSERPSGDIKLDKEGYVGYEQGKYEFKAELYLPSFQDLIMDGIIRTDVNPDENDKNRVFAEFRDRSNEELMLGLYYIHENTYIDSTGLEHAYGGIKLDDIGLPKAYLDSFDLAKMLKTAFNFFDNFLISFVDDFVKPKDDSKSDKLMQAIMSKMESTKAVEGDLNSKNTVNIRVDLQLVKDILYEEKGIQYTTPDIVNIINVFLGMDLDEIATILGVTNSETLLEQSWFYLTMDVDTNEITIKFFSDYNNTGSADMIMQLILWPEKVGEEVYMVFPSKLDEYKPLGKIETYSAEINGKFTFQNDKEIDLSGLLGSFMGDPLGLNTPYFLPGTASLEINLLFDQYIREQILEGGRLVQKSRNAFILRAFISDSQGNEQDLFRIYANDVSFKSDATVEDLGYIWVDLVCIPEIPKFKIREDIVLDAFAIYMGETGAGQKGTSLGVTTILAAILEESWPVFEPEVINITTSNETVRKIFSGDNEKLIDLIGDLNVKIGLKQRVKGIDQLEKDYANYRVGNFTNISGPNPYETQLHETLDVIFDYGNRQEIVPMKVAYDHDSIAIVENQVSYNVKIQDTFMGVTRGYTVTLTGGVGSRNKITDIKATSNNNFVWEPLELIPTRVIADYAGGQYTYDNVFYDNLDWSDITIAGGVFVTTVTIGKGMMASYSKEITITIIDRRVDTDETRRVVTQPYSTDRTRASVVDEIAIDPYEYILAKYLYFATPANQGKTDQDFLNHYFGQFTITINFMGSTPQYVGKFTNWKFDQFALDSTNPNHYDSRVWVEQDITPSGAEVKHWVFNGSELVLQSKDPFKEYIRLELDGRYMFEGEYFTFNGSELVPEDNEEGINYGELIPNGLYNYVSDGTYSTYMHTLFKGQVILLKVNVASRTFKELWFEGEDEPNTYTVDVLLRDSYTIPTKAKIIFEELDENGANYYLDLANLDPIISFNLFWSDPEVTFVSINGTSNPFGPARDNRVSARLSLFDSDRNSSNPVGVGEWFPAPHAIIKVLCPPKNVLNADTIVDDENGVRAVQSIIGGSPVYGNIDPSRISVGGSQNYGVYEVDPFNPDTWIIPQVVTILFEGGHTRDYTVEWDMTSSIVQWQDGKYLFLNVGEIECYYCLTAQVGNEDIGYQSIRLAIRNLTSIIEDATFAGHTGIHILGDLDTGYSTEINPFEIFELPNKINVAFADGVIRQYPVVWQGALSYVPGANFVITTKIGDASNLYFAKEQSFALTVQVKQLTINNIQIANMPDSNISVVINYQNKAINISGITLNPVNGLVENVTFGGVAEFDSLYDVIEHILQTFHLKFVEIAVEYEVQPNLYDYSVVFDTQEVIQAQGQNLTIGLARYPGSVDFTVNVKASGSKPLKKLQEHELLIPITPYQTDGTFNYPNGLDLSAQTITITFADHSSQDVNLSEWRIISCPSTAYKTGDIITVISAENVSRGGVWKLSSHLPDGSNIIRRFEISIIEIGSNYGTGSIYTGNLPIVDGKITIRDIYGFYPLQNYINLNNLPTTIVLNEYNNLVIDNIVWRLVPGLATALSQVNYQTSFAEQVIATADIMGKEVKLKLEVLPCIIKSVSVTNTAGGTVIQSAKDSTKLFFDPYHNSQYNGNFYFAELHYIVEYNTGATHRFTNLQFLINGINANLIYYDIYGHKTAVAVGTDVPDSNNITIRTTLTDGQPLNIAIQFYNKTFIGVGTIESTATDTHIIDTYYIDPYGDDVQVPSNVYIKFQEGRDLYIEDIGWTLPSGFRIDYRGGEYTASNNNTNLTKNLPSYGITQQKANWDLIVYKRELDSYTLGGIHVNDNPYWHIEDPYAGRVGDLPKVVEKYGENPNDEDVGMPFSALSIAWNLSDTDITYIGTTNLTDGYILVTGYVKNASVGQKVEINLHIDRWEFNGILNKYNDKYNIMNPAYFIFSRIDDKSLPQDYKIRFKTTDSRTGSIEYKEISFIAECYAKLEGEQEDMHIIYWNDIGKQQARSSDVPIATEFSIGNRYKAKVGINAIAVYYQYETPSVTRLDFGYGLGGKNEVILVLNPLDPIFPTVPLAIEGTTDQIKFVALDQFFDVSLSWAAWDAVAESKYLKGGIRYGYPVTVTLRVINEHDITIYQYTEAFRVNLLFLDMTQIQIPGYQADALPSGLSATVKSTYSENTYDGQVNPYGDAYTNYALYAGSGYFIYKALNDGYTNLGIDAVSLNYYDITWQPVPDPIGPDTILRSTKFTFNGKVFYSNHLRIKITSP